MKKTIMIWSVLALFAGSCTDDKDDVVIPPDLPDNDMNISIPDNSGSEEWVPGMEYAAYPGMPENDPGVEVNVLVIDAEEHGQNILYVLRNEAWPWVISDEDKQNLKQNFFPTHADIKLHITENYDDFNPNQVSCDIVNASTSVFSLDAARRNLEQFEDRVKFPKFPLVITSAGNGSNTFTQEAWDLCLELGGLSWEDHILPHFGWDPEGPFTAGQMAFYKPGDVGAAYVVQNVGDNGHFNDWIVVGRDDGYGNKPGPILKERWICTYYAFNMMDAKIDGTSFSTPYVVKIAAEIKRRAPHYTNNDIAQLIFSTADDLGSPGCDEVYGHGRMNPAEIWEELTRRGY